MAGFCLNRMGQRRQKSSSFLVVPRVITPMHARSVFFHMQRKNSTPKGTRLKDSKAWLSRRQIKFPTHQAHAVCGRAPPGCCRVELATRGPFQRSASTAATPIFCGHVQMQRTEHKRLATGDWFPTPFRCSPSFWMRNAYWRSDIHSYPARSPQSTI